MKAFPALAATLSVVTALLTACSAAPAGSTTPRSTGSVTPSGGASGARTTVAPPSAIRVFGRIFDNPGVTVTGGRLYVTWQVNAATAAVPRFELTRVDQADGAIEAALPLIAGQAGTPLSAGGWLWVPVATPSGESLLRLNPVDLARAGELSIRGVPDPGTNGGSHLAVADGSLWVADGGRLLRVSLKTGQLVTTIPLAGAATSGVAANKNGTVLVVTEGTDGGLGQVQRRNPVSGTVMASYQMIGVAAPEIGGVIESGVWIAEPTGMMGYIERFRAAGLAPDPATQLEGTNGIRVRVASGLVWITEGANPSHDYCADPVTGHVLARLPLPDPFQDGVLAVSSRYVYYDSPADHGFYLERLTVPAACR